MNALFYMSQGASGRGIPEAQAPYGFGRTAPAHAGEVLSETPDTVTISRRQRDVHVFFEFFAVAVAAPFSFWLATRKELPDAARIAAATIGVGTLIVDGGLLYNYVKEKKNGG